MSKLGTPYISQRVGNVLKVSGVMNLWARIRLAADHWLKEEDEVHAE